MTKAAKARRLTLFIITGLFVLLAAVSVALYVAFASPLVRAAFEGRSWGPINELVKQHRSYASHFRDLAYYQARAAMLFRFWLLALILGYGAVLSFLFARLARLLARYFNETSRPINLEIFRIVFFPSLIIFVLREARAVEFSSLPRDFLVSPFLLGAVTK